MWNKAKVLAPVLVVAALLGGCVVEPVQRRPMVMHGPMEVVAPVGPPAWIVEQVPVRSGYIWAPGHWRWDRGRYVAVRGHYERVRPGYRYAPGRWEQRGDGWHWRAGVWVGG